MTWSGIGKKLETEYPAEGLLQNEGGKIIDLYNR